MTKRKLWDIAITVMLMLVCAEQAFAYGIKDAINDCERRIRSEYGLIDVRDIEAVQLYDLEKHFEVRGNTKIEGRKYPWSCEIVRRKVVDTRYRGPRPFDFAAPEFDRRGPEIIPRRSGELEVRLRSGCASLYDRRGRVIDRNDRCDADDRRRADAAIDDYLRATRYDQDWRWDEERRDGWRREREPQRMERPSRPRPEDFISAPPRVTINRHGAGEVRYDNGCTVYYDPQGERTGATAPCHEGQLARADQEIRARREPFQ